MKLVLSGLLMAVFLNACTTTGSTSVSAVTPKRLSQSMDQNFKGQDFTWGGSVLSVKNLADHSLVEVMTYPLDSHGRPDAGGTPLGRFLADYPGFLEPLEFPGGQLVTVTGALLGYKDGKVGEADYHYPVLRADQIKRWENQRHTKPRVSVGFGFGSGRHSNIGIGVGF